MGGKRKYNTIEELFKDTLGNYHANPSPGFWKKFSRKLRLREFMKFKPGSFNIIYSGLLLAGLAASYYIFEFRAGAVEEPQKISQAIEAGSDIILSSDNSMQTGNEPSPEDKVPASSEVSKLTEREVLTDADLFAETKRRKEKIESLKINGNNIDNAVVSGMDVIERGEGLIMPSPEAFFGTNLVSGCLPLKVAFKNLSSNYDSCIWDFGDGGHSTVRDPEWIFESEGEYNVRLIVFGKEGRKASYTKSINVYPMPRARFEVNGSAPDMDNDDIQFYNYSENAVTWEWDFGDGTKSYDFEPAHGYDKHGTYIVRLTVVSDHGCVDSIAIRDTFGADSYFLRFPNAFIPNEGGPTGGYYSNRTDLESEVFHPVWSGVSDYNLKIFTRTGMLLFESTDIEKGWDGYFRGQRAEPGVYIWKVRAVFKNGEPFTKAGDVTLLPHH